MRFARVDSASRVFAAPEPSVFAPIFAAVASTGAALPVGSELPIQARSKMPTSSTAI